MHLLTYIRANMLVNQVIQVPFLHRSSYKHIIDTMPIHCAVSVLFFILTEFFNFFCNNMPDDPLVLLAVAVLLWLLMCFIPANQSNESLSFFLFQEYR